ncbi:MAG: MFS transporter, partial [Veillonella sp.]|nr:MFS transporter [Veillonella sp.]
MEHTQVKGEASWSLQNFMQRRMLHVVLPLFLVSIIACLDRVNISYASMTMKDTLSWLSPEVYGYGASIFFVGYVLFELPASLIASRFNAMKWVARIMFSWGLVCLLMTTMSTVFEFYLYRFLLGLCEASLYPVIYSLLIPNWFTPKERPKAISYMLTSLLVAQIIGAPLAGELLELNLFGLHGWQTLFIIEAIPAIAFALIFVVWMKAYPREAKWVKAEEVAYIEAEIAKEEAHKQEVKKYGIRQALTDG